MNDFELFLHHNFSPDNVQDMINFAGQFPHVKIHKNMRFEKHGHFSLDYIKLVGVSGNYDGFISEEVTYWCRDSVEGGMWIEDTDGETTERWNEIPVYPFKWYTKDFK